MIDGSTKRRRLVQKEKGLKQLPAMIEAEKKRLWPELSSFQMSKVWRIGHCG